MDKTFSVSDVSAMLGMKNEETIRRWIREEKLKAHRALGRGGSTMLLKDIIDFANRPPRAYLKSLISWLDANGIAYEKKSDTSSSKKQTKVIQDAALIGGMSSAILGSSSFPLIPGVATGIAAGVATSLASPKKSHVPFTIELVAPPKAPSVDVVHTIEDVHSIEQTSTDKTSGSSVCVLDSDEKFESTEVQNGTLDEESNIKAKIVDEQIKLIKLKQELAQIQAQISVTEGQIEYYNLLLQNN